MTAKVNDILTGNSGEAWFNGALVANLKSIEAKVSLNFEEQNVCGDYATHNVYNGWSGEGSMVWGKVDSATIKLMADSCKTGIMPEIKIISKLTSKATGKSERVAIKNVVLTEYFLAKFEAKSLIDEELPFKFSDFETLETI